MSYISYSPLSTLWVVNFIALAHVQLAPGKKAPPFPLPANFSNPHAHQLPHHFLERFLQETGINPIFSCTFIGISPCLSSNGGGDHGIRIILPLLLLRKRISIKRIHLILGRGHILDLDGFVQGGFEEWVALVRKRNERASCGRLAIRSSARYCYRVSILYSCDPLVAKNCFCILLFHALLHSRM